MTFRCSLLVAPCELEEIVELVAVCREFDAYAGAAGDLEPAIGAIGTPVRLFVELRTKLRALEERR